MNLLRVVEDLERMGLAIETLNTNLEALTVLLERFDNVPETLSDLRDMAAGTLGWKVTSKQEDRSDDR